MFEFSGNGSFSSNRSGSIRNPAGSKQYFSDKTGSFTSSRANEIFGSHERAGVRAEMSFTHNNEFMGIAPTHQKLKIALHEFHHLSAGKLTKPGTWKIG